MGPYGLDINSDDEICGYHMPPSGLYGKAQQMFAEQFGARESYLLVQGSSLGNMTMCLAALRPGDKVIAQRNAHKSVINGI